MPARKPYICLLVALVTIAIFVVESGSRAHPDSPEWWLARARGFAHGSTCRAEVVKSYGQIGNLVKAREVAHQYLLPQRRSWLSSIANAFYCRIPPESTESSAESVTRTIVNSEIWQALAEAQAEGGEITRAMVSAAEIGFVWSGGTTECHPITRTWCLIADACTRLRDPVRFQQCIAAAKEHAEKTGQEGSNFSCVRICESLARAGEIAQAKDLADGLGPISKGYAYYWISRITGSEKSNGAFENSFLDLAMSSARAADNMAECSTQFMAHECGEMALGELQRLIVEALLHTNRTQDGFDFASSIGNEQRRSEDLCRIVHSQIKSRDVAGSIKTGQNVPHDWLPRFFIAVAQAYREMGDSDHYDRFCRKARSSVEEVESPRARAWTYYKLAEESVSRGDMKAFTGFIERARVTNSETESFQNMQLSEVRGQILRHLIKADYLDKALQFARDAGKNKEDMEAICRACIDRGDFGTAIYVAARMNQADRGETYRRIAVEMARAGRTKDIRHWLDELASPNSDDESAFICMGAAQGVLQGRSGKGLLHATKR